MVNDSKKYFVYNGKKSSDFDVWASGLSIFHAPKKNIEQISVPGRNGDLLIEDGTFENVELEFRDCFIPRNFSQNFTNLTNFLNRQKGYQRLELSWLPDEYRMAAFHGDIEASMKNWDGKGNFDLAFDCKPQRFLKSGEEPIAVMVPIVIAKSMKTCTYQYPADAERKSIKVTVDSLPASGSVSVMVRHYTDGSDPSVVPYFEQTKTFTEEGQKETFSPRGQSGIYSSWLLEVTVANTDSLDDVVLNVEGWMTVQGQDYFYNSVFARSFKVNNPAGFTSKPTIATFGQALPYIGITSSDGEAWSLRGWDYSGAGATSLVLDCENEYCYDPASKTNLTQYIEMNHYDAGGGDLPSCFPALGDGETSFYMYYVGSSVVGDSFMLIYPHWYTI